MTSDSEPGAAPGEPPHAWVKRYRRILALVTVGTLVVMVAGSWARSSVEDHSLRDSFEPAQATYAASLSAFSYATELGTLNAAGAQARDAVPVLEETANQVDAPAPLPHAAATVLRHQKDVLVALSALAEFSVEDLSSWAAIWPDLQHSAKEVRSSTTQLAALAPALADGVPVATEAKHTILSIVGGLAGNSLGEQVAALISTASSAATTADVRQLAAGAKEFRYVVRSVSSGLPKGSSNRARLDDVGTVLNQLVALRSLDSLNLSLWWRVRPTLLEAVSATPEISTAGEEAVRRIDALVEQGAQEVGAWERQSQAIGSQKAQSSALVTAYARQTRTQLRALTRLEAALESFVTQADQVSSQEAAQTLSTLNAQLSTQRTALVQLVVPDPLYQPHSLLLSAIDTLVAVVAAGLPSSDEAACGGLCGYSVTAGWASLSAGYAEALDGVRRSATDWDLGVARAKAEIQAQPTPPRPEV